MRKSFLLIPISISLILIFAQCNSTKYQYSAYKKVHHSVENTDYYNILNKYQKDFLILTNIVKESYPNRKEILSDSLWEVARKEGIKKLENATDTTAILEYQRFLALLKNNHTEVTHPVIYNLGDKIFLFTAHYLNDKWIIFDAHKDYPQNLITSQLLAINGIPIDTVYKKIEPYLNEESKENMYNTVYKYILFGRPVFLKALGLHNKQDSETMILSISDSSKTIKDISIKSVYIKNDIK